jgi:PAS domain S-box-containing protein
VDPDAPLVHQGVLEAALDGMSDGVAVCDLTGRFLVFNEPARRILGIGPVDTVPEKWSREYGLFRPDGSTHYPPDELPLVRALRGEASDHVALFVRNPRVPDGLAISVSARPLTGGDGRRFGAVAVFRDITEQRRIEEAMRVRDRALAAVSDGVIITDPSQPDNPIIHCNEAIARITGYEPSEIVGRNCRFLQGTDRDQDARETVRGALENEESCRVLLRNYRKSGELFWNELSLSPVRDASGRTTHFVGVVHDATERIRLLEARAEYERALQNLAVRVPRAEESERRRIATELHDELAQKLAFALLTLTELGRHTSGKGRPALDRLETLLRESVEQVRSLIFDLSPPVLYDLGFGAAVEWLAERTETRHHLRCTVTDEGAPTSIDEDRSVVLFQAVRELLQNAVKHSGARRVHVRLGADGEGGIRVEVADDGKGFDPERLEHALTGGTSFGLFNVRERVRNLGGSCDLLEAESGGARVLLRLPARPGRESPPPA